MENGSLKRFKIYKILHSPVHRAFVYVFSQTYTQDSDVYSSSVNCGYTGYFTETELSALQHEKRIARHSLPLLFKVIKTSCNPSLALPTSPVWKRPAYADSAQVENLLVTLMKLYEDFSNSGGNGTPLSEAEFDLQVTELTRCLENLVEEAGKFDVTGRWREDLEKIMNLVKEICLGEQKKASHDEITSDIQVELHMKHEMYSSTKNTELDPMQLWLGSTVAQDSVAKKSTMRKQPRMETGHSIGVKNLVEELESCGGGRGRVCLIQGEPGCGRSSLATLLALSWAHKDERVTRIGQYSATIVVSGGAVTASPHDFIHHCLPLATLTHGVDRIRQWLSESKVLLVVDDGEELSQERTEELRSLIEASKAVDVVLLSSVPSHCHTLEEDWTDIVGKKLYLNGYDREKIVVVAEEILCNKKKAPDPKDLKKYLTKNMCRLAHILRHPQVLLQVCNAFCDNPNVYKKITTATDMMWTLTLLQINKGFGTLYDDENKDLQVNVRNWMMLAGQKALEAFRDNKRLEGDYMDELVNETSIMLSSPVCQKLMTSVFKRRSHHNYTPASKIGYSCTHIAQQEFFAAWYAAHEVVTGKKLLSLIGELQCAYQLAIFMGGLIPKVKNNKCKLSDLDERRLVSAILNHTEESSEDLTFNFDLVAEVKASPKFLEYIVEGSEYPDEWNISAGDIQLIPLEALLLNVSPTRIFLNVEELKPYSELSKVLSFMCRVDIFVWLDSSCQFRYGNSMKMDRLIKGFFCDEIQKIDILNVVTKIDLIAGYMSTSLLRELPSQPAFTHLVYLKLRVLDKKTLSLLLVINKYLHKLLWLEVKIDFKILEEEYNDLPLCTISLMDVHLQGMKDKSVAKLARLLGIMHTCYSGIHLENTTMTPEGLFVLLKQLQKRNIRLYSYPEARAQFRRWYYPQLSTCDPSLVLTDEVALELLGFDDRKYYSNHFVGSNCYAVAIDAWNLMSYLEEQEDIVHFNYKTENLSFIKRLTGSVDIEVHKENGEKKLQIENGH